MTTPLHRAITGALRDTVHTHGASVEGSWIGSAAKRIEAAIVGSAGLSTATLALPILTINDDGADWGWYYCDATGEEASPKDVADHLNALAARCAEDTARLDFIERTRCYPFANGAAGWIMIVSADRSSVIQARGTGPTARAAIDDAMKAMEA